jgi:hypothetical protein
MAAMVPRGKGGGAQSRIGAVDEAVAVRLAADIMEDGFVALCVGAGVHSQAVMHAMSGGGVRHGQRDASQQHQAQSLAPVFGRISSHSQASSKITKKPSKLCDIAKGGMRGAQYECATKMQQLVILSNSNPGQAGRLRQIS